MEAYTSFARVYDIFMDNVPYKEWADYLGKILKACSGSWLWNWKHDRNAGFIRL